MAGASPALAEALRDRYMLERELGHGGMATVYLARDLKHDRYVAVKVLRPDLAAVLGAERFLREIRLTAQLQHPHILSLLDSGEAAGLLFYVMPYIEGESLRERLAREGQLPIEEALGITRAVAGALDYAHQRGVIHRDIKPENILLYQGEPMVADFGVALAAASAGRERLTETGLSLGTPAYMSPEQASAAPKLDGRSDQYSLACVLFEMLAGEPPYTGPTAQAIIAKRFSEPIPHLGTLRPVPPGVEAAVSRALAKSPADRFSTAGEFVAALEKAPRARLLSPRRAAVLGAVAAIGIVVLLAFLIRPGRGNEPQVQRQFTFTGKASEPVISPDGEWLAYVSGWRSLIIQRLTGGEPVVLVPPARFIFGPRWTGDGAAIVFSMFRDSTQLAATYMVPRSGGSVRKVLEDIVPFDTWRDSTVVVRAPREKRVLQFESLQTGKVLRSIALPDSLGEVDQVDWSPDRRLIGFTNADGVWTVSADGGQPSRIAAGRNIRWSPASDALYFMTGPAGAVALMKSWINPRSGASRGGVVRIMSLPTASSFDLAANGNLVYGQTNTGAQARALVFGGAVPRRVVEDRFLTEGTGRVSGVAISPDGESVAFSQARGDDEGIYLVPFVGGSARPLTSSPARELNPSWSPNGSQLAYARADSGQLAVMVRDIGGGGSRPASSVAGPGSCCGISTALWSAMGTHLAYYSRDLRRAVLVDIAHQAEDVLRIPDSIGTGYDGVLPSPDGRELILSTLVRTTDWGELWLASRTGAVWRRLRGPFGESFPVAWRSDGWIYLRNLRALQTDYGTWRAELWRKRGPNGTPELYAPLPMGCRSTVLAADATRAVCRSVRIESDVFLTSNFDPDLR
jgi:Tol biopolymer transport system component